MSDEVTAAIETSIAGMEGSESVSDVPVDAGSGTTTPPAPVADPSVPATTPAETPAVPPPVEPETPRMQEGEPEPKRAKYMPMDRHDRVLAATRDEHTKTVQQLTQYHQQEVQSLQTRAQLLDVADQDPQRFLDALAAADPRYAQLLQRHSNGNGHHAPQADPNAGMPEPDAQFADGSVGYSPAGLKALLDWNAGTVESRISQRYKAIEDAHLADQQINAAKGRVTQKVQQAMQWKAFNENQDEIAAALRADRNLTLETAYIKVVIPKLEAERNRMRADLLAEINGKPMRVTGTTPAAGVPPAVLSDDIESVIKASIANLPR
jgi:hypothetical protein